MQPSSVGMAPPLVLKIQEQIEEARTRIEQINAALFEKTGNRFEDTLDAVNADDMRSYWQAKLVELQGMLTEYSTTSKQSDAVVKGDVIELRRLMDKTDFQFRLIDNIELFPDERCVSIDSPLGRAILGKHQGEHVTVETPMGIQEYKIMNVVAGAQH